MLRFILCILIAIIYLIVTLPVLLILWIAHKRHPDGVERVTTAMIRWIFRVICAGAGIHTTVIGAEKLPADRPVLYIGNHRSIFDIIISYCYLPGVTGYVAKDALSRIPLFSLWATYISCIYLNRDDPKAGLTMLRESVAHIKAGKSVFIFPEGTRNKQEADLPLLPFHEGSLRIAQMAGAAIVPVSQNNTAQVWESHFPWVHSTHTVIEFGDPIFPEDIPKAERKHVGAIVSARMAETIERNAALLR